MNEIQDTQKTYAQIASDYAVAWADRGSLDKQIARFLDLVQPGGRVFDMGCGPGFDTAVFQQHNLSPIGLDYSMQMMLTGRRQHQISAPMVQVDMRQLPFAQCADGIWACASLLHLPRVQMLPTLQGFHRLLKPGGLLYLSVKLGKGEEWTSLSYGHQAKRYFTYWQPDELDDLLQTAVYEIVDGWIDSAKGVQWLVRYARKEHQANDK